MSMRGPGTQLNKHQQETVGAYFFFECGHRPNQTSNIELHHITPLGVMVARWDSVSESLQVHLLKEEVSSLDDDL